MGKVKELLPSFSMKVGETVCEKPDALLCYSHALLVAVRSTIHHALQNNMGKLSGQAWHDLQSIDKQLDENRRYFEANR